MPSSPAPIPGGPLTPMPGQGMPTKSKPPVIVILSIVVLTLLSIALIVVLLLVYGQMKDYKDNSDQKSAVAVQKANTELEAKLKAQFAEAEKEPLRSYTTPNASASVKIVYPKTWSLYTIEGKDGGEVEGYFNPNFVPNVGNNDNVYALRVEVLNKPYASVSKTYESAAKKGEVTITPYKPAKVGNAETGIRIDGEVRDNVQGAMIIVPVRDKTIRIWTESEAYLNDFDTFVLKNLEYSP